MDFEYEKNEKLRELCYIGDLELIKAFCINEKPDVNSKNKINQWTALHWAAKQNNLELVKYLLEIGASIDNKDKDDRKPSYFAKDPMIKSLLTRDVNENQLNLSKTVETVSSQISFIPNFIKNPDFHYGNKQLFNGNNKNGSSDTLKETSTSGHQTKSNIAISDSNMISNHSQNRSEIVTIRVKANTDEDFIEIDIDKMNLDFETFKNICRKELDHIDLKKSIFKIRKLPNVLIRNTNDIKRLKMDQEIEFVFN